MTLKQHLFIFKNRLCKIFGHKWRYYTHCLTTPATNFRVCKHCDTLQQYHSDVPACKPGWFSMVGRTNKGAKEWLKQSNIKE